MQPIRKMWETTRPSRPAGPAAPVAPVKGGKPSLPLIILTVLFLASAGGCFYLFERLLAAERVPAADAAQVRQDEATAAVVAEVGKLMVLPSDETPTVATVSDPSKLADQAFFAHAKAGDKVIIYTKAKKAVLYSPTDNRIVEVAAISLDSSAPAAP